MAIMEEKNTESVVGHHGGKKIQRVDARTLET